MAGLLDQILKTRRSLSNVPTRVLTPDGRELLEQRNSNGSVKVIQLSKRPWGFVGDLKPDLQVAEVLPGLLLGSQDVAQDLSLLQKHNVTHILNVATGIRNLYPSHFTYKVIEILDLPSEDISKHFSESFDFIQSALRGNGTVLVHCNAGVSRSVTIVIAYLIKFEHKTFQEALSHVRSVRAAARPNEGFVSQLKKFETGVLAQRAQQKNMHLASSECFNV